MGIFYKQTLKGFKNLEGFGKEVLKNIKYFKKMRTSKFEISNYLEDKRKHFSTKIILKIDEL